MGFLNNLFGKKKPAVTPSGAAASTGPSGEKKKITGTLQHPYSNSTRPADLVSIFPIQVYLFSSFEKLLIRKL
jgi:hypothetical protein